MKLKLLAAALALSPVALVALSAAQDKGSATSNAKPTQEHEILERKAGTWDASVQMSGAADVIGKATFTAKLDHGGLWLVGDYRGDFMGEAFSGHEVTGFDSARGKYVSIWVDSWVDHAMYLEGDYDEAKHTLALWTEGPDPEGGKPVKERHDHSFVDADTWVYTMNRARPDGTYAPLMTITYKRKK